MEFEDTLRIGKVAEGLIAKWLQSRGSAILPAYEIEKSHGKGPQLFSEKESYVSPDMLVFTHNGICWVEAKHKSVFTWHRNTAQWTTGIDLRHYVEYCRVSGRTRLPVWLMFYHRESQPTPADRQYCGNRECPTGLFGRELFDLVGLEHHRAKSFDKTRVGEVGHGKTGMVYWSEYALKLLATKVEILKIERSRESEVA